MKIDILDDSIQTPEWFRGLSDIYRSTEGLPDPPEVIGPHGPKWWKRRGGQGATARPSPRPKSELDKEGGAPPFPFPLSLLPSPLLLQQEKGGVILPVGGGLPIGRTKSRRPPPPPPLLYIRGGGHPLGSLIVVCGAPSPIIHLGQITAVLRRSPASVEHHHHHHAIVLTELSLKARLDRSSRDVIQLNVC